MLEGELLKASSRKWVLEESEFSKAIDKKLGQKEENDTLCGGLLAIV